MIIALIDTLLGSYNDHLDDPVHVHIDGKWYSSTIRRLPDVEHLLSLHPIYTYKGQAKRNRSLRFARVIDVTYDTGGCGDATIGHNIQPAAAHLTALGLVQHPAAPPGPAVLRLRWDPQQGNDGVRFFFGGFEVYKEPEPLPAGGTPIHNLFPLGGKFVRERAAVRSLGIKTIEELVTKTADDLFKIKGCKYVTIKQIRVLLKARGLHLKGDAG